MVSAAAAPRSRGLTALRTTTLRRVTTRRVSVARERLRSPTARSERVWVGLSEIDGTDSVRIEDVPSKEATA